MVLRLSNSLFYNNLSAQGTEQQQASGYDTGHLATAMDSKHGKVFRLKKITRKFKRKQIIIAEIELGFKHTNLM